MRFGSSHLVIDDVSLIPGWHTCKNFSIAHSSQVSAGTLSSSIAPGSLLKASHSRNPDKDTWLASYQEENNGLSCNDTFDVILEDEYRRLRSIHGVNAIPSMCIFTVKHTNGIPTRAKRRIVVLENLDQRTWSKSDCFSPVASILMIRLLTTLAVQNNRTLKQGDCKCAFIQASLPAEELTIVKPPIGCPLSNMSHNWKLMNSLHGL